MIYYIIVYYVTRYYNILYDLAGAVQGRALRGAGPGEADAAVEQRALHAVPSPDAVTMIHKPNNKY